MIYHLRIYVLCHIFFVFDSMIFHSIFSIYLVCNYKVTHIGILNHNANIYIEIIEIPKTDENDLKLVPMVIIAFFYLSYYIVFLYHCHT